MLLDRSSADFSGLTCNKIGVSFSAFRYQGGACGNWPQACLGNQLDNYHQEDLARVHTREVVVSVNLCCVCGERACVMRALCVLCVSCCC